MKRATSSFILQTNSLFHPTRAAMASTAGWTKDTWGALRRCNPRHICVWFLACVCSSPHRHPSPCSWDCLLSGMSPTSGFIVLYVHLPSLSVSTFFFFFSFIQLIKAAMKTYLLKTNGNSFYCEYPMTILFSPASNIPQAPCQHGCCLADHTCGARPRCHVTLCEQLLPFPPKCVLFSRLAAANPSLVFLCFPALKSPSPLSQPWGWGRTNDAWRPCEPTEALLCRSHLSHGGDRPVRASGHGCLNLPDAGLRGGGRPSWGQSFLCLRHWPRDSPLLAAGSPKDTMGSLGRWDNLEPSS